MTRTAAVGVAMWLMVVQGALGQAGSTEAGSPGDAVSEPAVEQRAEDEAEAVGYADADGDGANDRFRDADGDGVDDVTRTPYAHRFGMVDADGDGRNDRFQDADGDGVNDLDGAWVDADGDGVCDNVLDADGDGRNDITGMAYGRDLGGRRYGRIDEESGESAGLFVDEDGDGMHDGWAAEPEVDLFIDEDGDGIADGRTVRGRRQVEREAEAWRGARRSAAGSEATGAAQDQGAEPERERQRRQAGQQGRD